MISIVLVLVLCIAVNTAFAEQIAAPAQGDYIKIGPLAGEPYYQVCSDSMPHTHVDPSLGDILHHLARGVGVREEKFLEYTTQYNQFFSVANKIKLPLIRLISTSEYEIKAEKIADLPMSNVILLKEKSWIERLLCELLSDKLGTFICGNDNFMVGDTLINDIIADTTSNYFVYDTCLTPQCQTNRYFKMETNPWQKSCVVFFGLKPSEENDPVIRYREYIPKLKYVGELLRACSTSLRENLKTAYSTEQVFVLTEALNSLGNIADYVFKHIPRYLANLLVGSVLLLYGRDWCKSKVFQVALMGSLGVLLALVFVVYLIYKSIFSVFRQTLPAAASVPLMLVSSSMIIYGVSLYSTLFDFVWKFWDNGYPFGVCWLGKAYFLLSFLLSSIVTVRWGLFAEQTVSHDLLVSIMYLLGLYFFYHGLSSTAVLAAMVAAAYCYQELLYLSWRTYLGINQQLSVPPERYRERVLTMEEYDEQGETFTQRELAKLRKHLQSNPMVVDRYIDACDAVSGREAQIEAMQRFVTNKYSGRPKKSEADYDEDDEANDYRGGAGFLYRYVFRSWKSLFVWTVIVLIVSFAVASKWSSLTNDENNYDFNDNNSNNNVIVANNIVSEIIQSQTDNGLEL